MGYFNFVVIFMEDITNTDALIADKLLRIQLSNFRRSKGLTQKQLSNISGLSESIVIIASDRYCFMDVALAFDLISPQ